MGHSKHAGAGSIAAVRSAIQNGFKDDAFKDSHLRILDQFETVAYSIEMKLILGNGYKDIREIKKARSLKHKISSLVKFFVNPLSLMWTFNWLLGGLVLLYSVCQYIYGNFTQEQLRVIARKCGISREQFKVIANMCDNPAPSPPRSQKTKTNMTQYQRIENLRRKVDTEFEISKLIMDEVPELRAFINEVLMMLYHWSCRTSSLVKLLCLKHDKQTHRRKFLDSACQFADLKITWEKFEVIDKSCHHTSPNPLPQENMTCSIGDKLKIKIHLTQCQQIENLHKQKDKKFGVPKLLRNEVHGLCASAINVLEEYLFLWCRVCSLKDRKCYLEKQKTLIAVIEDSFIQFNEGKITREQLEVIVESSVKHESPSHHHLEPKDISVVLGESLATGRTNQVNHG